MAFKEDFFDEWESDLKDNSVEVWDEPDDWANEGDDRTQRGKSKKFNTVLLAKILAVLLCVLSGTILIWETVLHKESTLAPSQPEHSATTVPYTSPVNTTNTSPAVSKEAEADFISDSDLYYFRTQLRSDEKKLYDEICSQLVAGSNRVEHLYADNTDQIERVLLCVLYDHPEIYWLEKNYNFSWTAHGKGIEVSLELKPLLDASQRELVRKRLKAVTAQIKRNYGASSDYEKARGVYEYIIDNAIYDLGSSSQSFSDILLYGRGVCAGYTALTQYLLQQLGIPTIYVTGMGKGESHAWNIVQLDGEWYQLDTTWGDPVSDSGNAEQTKNYYYFCLTDADMYLDHTPDSAYIYPKCIAMACNYYVREGLFTDHYDESWLISLMKRYQGKPLEFRAASRKVFEEYKERLLDDGRFFELAERAVGKKADCSWTEKEHLLILRFEP